MILKRIFIFLVFCLYFCTANGQTSRALFVAIDKYPTGHGWSEIHSTNDIGLMMPMLKKRGFKSENIEILINEQAIKSAIIKELKLLADDSHVGDNIYIHFSCHGQQMADDNGDELDRLDESLVPYDAKRRFTAEIYEGENHIRDDLMGSLLDEIRKSIGESGYVTLIIDACHSGTANRDNGDGLYKRGTTYVFGPKDYIQPFEFDNKVSFKLEQRSGFSPITVFSACLPSQINYEYLDPVNKIYYGSLSYALYEVFSRNDEYSATQLHNALEKEIATMFKARKKRQIPYMESTNKEGICLIGGNK